MLRTIRDRQGELWEVARGHESYGAMVVLFCCKSDQRVMKSYLYADTALEADREIDAMSDGELADRLDEAESGP